MWLNDLEVLPDTLLIVLPALIPIE